MDMVNTAVTFLMNTLHTVTGWFSSFFGSILPGATASDEKKNQFIKYGLIVAGLLVAAKVLRLNLNVGGGKAAKK